MNNGDICEMVMTSDKVSMALPCFLTQRNSAHKSRYYIVYLLWFINIVTIKTVLIFPVIFGCRVLNVNYRTVSIVNVMDH